MNPKKRGLQFATDIDFTMVYHINIFVAVLWVYPCPSPIDESLLDKFSCWAMGSRESEVIVQGDSLYM